MGVPMRARELPPKILVVGFGYRAELGLECRTSWKSGMWLGKWTMASFGRNGGNAAADALVARAARGSRHLRRRSCQVADVLSPWRVLALGGGAGGATAAERRRRFAKNSGKRRWRAKTAWTLAQWTARTALPVAAEHLRLSSGVPVVQDELERPHQDGQVGMAEFSLTDLLRDELGSSQPASGSRGVDFPLDPSLAPPGTVEPAEDEDEVDDDVDDDEEDEDGDDDELLAAQLREAGLDGDDYDDPDYEENEPVATPTTVKRGGGTGRPRGRPRGSRAATGGITRGTPRSAKGKERAGSDDEAFDPREEAENDVRSSLHFPRLSSRYSSLKL